MHIRMITIRLPPDVERRVEDLVSRAGHTKTFYIAKAVLEYLDDLEETYPALSRPEHPAKRWTPGQAGAPPAGHCEPPERLWAMLDALKESA